MKTVLRLQTILLAALLLFTSCKKDDNNEPNNTEGQSTAFFSAKIDNQAFTKPSIQMTSAKYIPSTKMLQIIGQPEDQKETIVLTLFPFGSKIASAADWKPGTYDFDPVHVTNLEYLASAEYNLWNGNSYDQWFTEWDHVKTGKIIIETNSGAKIKGSFHFDAVRKNSNGSYNTSSIKKITEGKFDLDIKSL